MYKGQVTSKNKGLLMLPTLGKRAKASGETFAISEKDFWNDDIQKSLKQGLIVFLDKTPALKKVKIVQNISTSSIALGKYGILKSMGTKEIDEEDLKHPDIRLHIDNNKLKEITTAKQIVKGVKEESPVDRPMKPVVYQPKSDLQEKPKKKKGKTVKKVNTDNLLIENGIEAEENTEDIKFVDIEQAEERISQHPILSKIKTNKE